MFTYTSPVTKALLDASPGGEGWVRFAEQLQHASEVSLSNWAEHFEATLRRPAPPATAAIGLAIVTDEIQYRLSF